MRILTITRIVALMPLVLWSTTGLLSQDRSKDSLFTQNRASAYNSTNTPRDTMVDKTRAVPISDSSAKSKSEAKKASIRSAFIPGWGQAYNKRYWKIPVVYAALAIPAGLYIYNRNWYNKTRYAYTVKVNNDTANYVNIDEQLKPLSTESTRLYRNEFRKNMDLSLLAFIIVWGLQVADAAVDGHMKTFNISDDLSLQMRPRFSSPGQPLGLGLQFQLGKPNLHRTFVAR
jgi:hypothetical protein